jgi:hypothetical protein
LVDSPILEGASADSSPTSMRNLVALSIAGGLVFFAAASCVTNPSLGAAAHDADAGDAASAPTAPTPTVDGGVPTATLDAGPVPNTCAAYIASLLVAPLRPPNTYAGFNLTTGTNPRGLTIEEANFAGCATLDPDVPGPNSGGTRGATWGTSDDVVFAYNSESHVISGITLGAHYAATVKAQSRIGGDFGTHTYEIGNGHVLRDGTDMPLDWTASPHPWADELVDALNATLSPSLARIGKGGCEADGTCLLLPDDGTGTAILGARELAFYMQFTPGTNHLRSFYAFWKNGFADCTTPKAAREAMVYGYIQAGFPVAGGGVTGAQIGGIAPSKRKPDGLTWQDADAIGCGGTQVAAEDAGYGAIQWGNGEVVAEYNKTTNILYKVSAKAGYKGTLDGQVGADSYSVGIGTLTKNGAPFAIDWASPKASATALVDAVTFGADDDCVAAGTCTLTADDGLGHSVIDLPKNGITIVFDKGTSTPRTIFTVWPNGK